MTTKGRITLPLALRRLDGIRAGQEFDVTRVKPGEYALRAGTARRNEGLVDLLLACPVKDFFAPLNPSETTDDLDRNLCD